MLTYYHHNLFCFAASTPVPANHLIDAAHLSSYSNASLLSIDFDNTSMGGWHLAEYASGVSSSKVRR